MTLQRREFLALAVVPLALPWTGAPATSAQGVQVRAVTRDPEKADTIRLPHVEVVKGDFEESSSRRTTLRYSLDVTGCR
jgi:hypothetical protein